MHAGRGGCGAPSAGVLYRVDMSDSTGVAACEGCADDMLDSGVFSDCRPVRKGRDESARFAGATW